MAKKTKEIRKIKNKFIKNLYNKNIFEILRKIRKISWIYKKKTKKCIRKKKENIMQKIEKGLRKSLRKQVSF